MLFSVQLEGEYSPAFKTHFSQRIGNFDIVIKSAYNKVEVTFGAKSLMSTMGL
jgi:hypothetical protein